MYRIILRSKLYLSISYLHYPKNRLTGLEYDISEIYKPIIVDRTIFTCINKKIITKDDFVISNEGVFLKWDARRKFIEQFYNRLNSTISINNRRISYKELIKKDCVELRKFVNGEIDILSFHKTRW